MMFAIIPLLLLGGIIALIVRLVGGRGSDVADTDGAGVRRFFQYALLLAVVIIVAIGASDLLAELIPGEELLRDTTDRRTRAASFLVIGGPVLYGLVRWVRSGLEQESERRSLAWALYLGTAAMSGLITATGSFFLVAQAVFGINDFEPESLAMAVVWGAVWWIHYRIGSQAHHAGRLRLHLAAGSFTGLLTIAIAAGALITAAMTVVFDRLIGTTTIVTSDSDIFLQAFIGLVIGAAIWTRYWLTTYATVNRDAVWHGYVLLAGVLGGLATLLISATVLLFVVLDWFFGGSGSSAASHFQDIPGVTAGIAVGVGLWGYHRSVLRGKGPVARSEIDRIYQYLVAGLGLLAAAGGLTTILVALIEAILPGRLSSNTGGDGLIVAVAILLVGVPVWWRTWADIQRRRTADPVQELSSPSRRVYLFALFGLGGVTALISLLTLAYMVFRDLFDGAFGSGTAYSIRWPLALVIMVGAVAAYHWVIRKEDELDAPAEEDVQHDVRLAVLVSANGRAIADEVAMQTGVRVRAWDRPDTEATASVEAVIDAITAGTHPRLLLIARDGTIEALPYTERF